MNAVGRPHAGKQSGRPPHPNRTTEWSSNSMTETMYTRDPRVVWHDGPQCYTVDTGADPPPAVYRGAIDGHPDVWVARADPPWERIEGVPDSTDLDEVLTALIGQPWHLDDAGLLLAAAGTDDGWLSASWVGEVHGGPAAMELLAGLGLFEPSAEVPGWWITATGRGKAAMLGHGG